MSENFISDFSTFENCQQFTHIVLSHEPRMNEFVFGIFMHELIGKFPIGTLLQILMRNTVSICIAGMDHLIIPNLTFLFHIVTLQ